MPDYSNTILYKIVCNTDPSKIYVGHTTNYSSRVKSHTYYSNGGIGHNMTCPLYQTINQNGGWSNWTMSQIETYPCENSNEARQREREWYDILNPKANTRSPFGRVVDNSERCKKWRDNHSKCVCECGGSYTITNKARHLKSDKHLKYLNF